ncbi:MAG TPA: uroporphyrinogen decarboxylase [Candidatus Acidoferrales bacterium]|nr:uroporphyrinogen decarboxylase [Candidatus Acidoferrales bacterium]
MTLLQTLRGRNAKHAPIWLMRQAGRYLPEYRAIKERSSFREMTRTPEIAAEVTLLPMRRFALDAAIVFADIMTPLEALGVDVAFDPGPSIAQPLRSAQAIDALTLREPIAPFVGQALRIVRAELPPDVALVGFAGAPLTLAAYLVEGSGSKEFQLFRRFLRAEPAAVHRLLDKLAGMTAAYLRMQIESGAQVVQLFDSWAGLHDAMTYREFGVPYAARIMDAVAGTGAARIFFALGASHLLDEVAEIPCEAVGVDWRTDLRLARAKLGNRALQGNLDPAMLYAPVDELARGAVRVLENGLGGPHVFNLGHGIWPATPLDAVARLVDVVHSYERT